MSAATPWWASDDGIDELDVQEDPFDAHWSARADEGADAPDWVRLVGDVAVGAVRRLGTLAEETTSRADHAHSPSGEDAACRNCPICTVLRAADRSGGDVSSHLADAARHLALAAASFLEALAEQPNGSQGLAGKHGDGVADREDRAPEPGS